MMKKNNAKRNNVSKTLGIMASKTIVPKSVKSACGKGKKSVKGSNRRSKKSIKAAESYGWVVESWEAGEAYDLAAEYFGVEDINQQIVDCISSDELASCLAYIFRMNDFREWDDFKERNDNSDDEEDVYELPDADVKLSLNELIDYVRSNITTLTYDDLNEASDMLNDEYRIYKASAVLQSTEMFKALDSILDEISNEMDRRDAEDVAESVRVKGKKAVRASKLRKGRSKKSIKAARLTIDFGQYKPWSGAVDTWENLERFDKVDLLEQILDDTYYDENAGEAVLSETELNDLLWFEPETVYEWVGLYYDDNTGEVSDEPFDNDYDEDDEIEESVRAKGRKSVKASSEPLSTSEKKACIDQIAYDYGVSKKQATEWYNSYSDERRRLILDGGKASAKKSFYND